MTATSNGDRAAEHHVEEMELHLAQLRQRSEMLGRLAQQANQRAKQARDRPRQACNHAEEAREIQATLARVQHELDGLRVAMQTRGVIEQAKGMLMLEHKCSDGEAFEMLVRLSQTSHRKLFEVATTLVATWSGAQHANT